MNKLWLIVGMVGFGYVYGVSHNHLRIWELLEQQRRQILADTTTIASRNEQLPEALSCLWGVENLEQLVTAVYQLKQQRDQIVDFLTQVAHALKESDRAVVLEYKDFTTQREMAPEDRALSEQLTTRYERLFERLAEILDVDKREIAGAIIQLRREWEEAGVMLKKVTEVVRAGV
jgi:hypothetical protein